MINTCLAVDIELPPADVVRFVMDDGGKTALVGCACWDYGRRGLGTSVVVDIPDYRVERTRRFRLARPIPCGGANVILVPCFSAKAHSCAGQPARRPSPRWRPEESRVRRLG